MASPRALYRLHPLLRIHQVYNGPQFIAATGTFTEDSANLGETPATIRSMRGVSLLTPPASRPSTACANASTKRILIRDGTGGYDRKNHFSWSSDQAIVQADKLSCIFCLSQTGVLEDNEPLDKNRNSQPEWIVVKGIIVAGHRVASQPSQDYPYAALEKQKPYFRERGLDLDRFFLGTLNVSIAPLVFEMVKPEYTFPLVAWTDLHPPETFSFSPCKVRSDGREYAGMIYYPHPETKIRHFQNPSLVEVLSERIPGIGVGSQVELLLDPEQIRISN